MRHIYTYEEIINHSFVKIKTLHTICLAVLIVYRFYCAFDGGKYTSDDCKVFGITECRGLHLPEYFSRGLLLFNAGYIRIHTRRK